MISALPSKYAATATERRTKLDRAMHEAAAADDRRWLALQLEDTPEARARQYAFWEQVRATVGTIVAIRGLGEIASGNGIDAYARIDGSRGAMLVRIVYSHDECIQDVDLAPTLPEFRFARESEGTFIHYDMRNQIVVRLRFDHELTIEAPNGTFHIARSASRGDA